MLETCWSISHVYSQKGKGPVHLERNGIVGTNLAPSEWQSGRGALFYLWLCVPSRHERNHIKPISKKGISQCGSVRCLMHEEGQWGKILENDLLRWLTKRGLLSCCSDGKICGISGINEELSAPACMFYPKSGDLYVFKWEGLGGTRSLSWEDRGLSGTLSLIYPQDALRYSVNGNNAQVILKCTADLDPKYFLD